MRVLLSFGPLGYTGEVVTLDDPKQPYSDDIPFPVHALGPIDTVYGFTRKLLPWLRANRDRFDGIVVNGLWQYCGLAAWLALGGRKPYVVFTHGMLDPYFKHRFPRKHMKKWVYWLLAEYWVLRGAYRVLFTTKEESRLAEQSFWLHQWNGFVVPYGASRPPKQGEVLREAFLAEHPGLRGRRFLLYLGRIHPKKGCDLLIRAFVKLAALDPELHLVMAGPDFEDWSETLRQIVLEAGLTQRVHWPGMLRGEVKWGAFFASEAFILPSHQENFGIAVAEALSCGRAVLLADKINIAREVADEGAGLMELDTQEGTENLIRRWIEMPVERREAMYRQALKTFDEHYDMRRNAVTIIRLFERSGSLEQ